MGRVAVIVTLPIIFSYCVSYVDTMIIAGVILLAYEELFSNIHPDIMFQHIVINRGEGKIQYELKDLARNALLLDLDYFIIGEIKGDEAVHFLTAAYTGHQCWASVHGISSTEAIDKLADYAIMSVLLGSMVGNIILAYCILMLLYAVWTVAIDRH